MRFSHVLICRYNGGPHDNLPVSTAGSQCRTASGFKPAVQGAFFWRSRAATRAAPLQSRVANGLVVASKCERHTVAINGGFTNCIIAFSLNVKFGVMVLRGPFLRPALAVCAASWVSIFCPAQRAQIHGAPHCKIVAAVARVKLGGHGGWARQNRIVVGLLNENALHRRASEQRSQIY